MAANSLFPFPTSVSHRGLASVRFVPTELEGAWIVEPERQSDDRGFFARSWCQQGFAERGLNANLVQCNISFNRYQGTVRGMHFQRPPHEEAKLVRCTSGAIFDVIVDLRPESPTFLRNFGVRLDSTERNALFVPEGFAHGFQTLEDSTEVLYQMSIEYRPESASGLRWNDPALQIEWPLPIRVISDKDSTLPTYSVWKESA
jgi:dTDP-4-dehydrorhamnose 3,5-epimerase